MKDLGLKEYLISQRKKIKAGVSGAPVWVMMKSGKRMWNKRGKRNWRRTELGHEYNRVIGKY